MPQREVDLSHPDAGQNVPLNANQGRQGNPRSSMQGDLLACNRRVEMVKIILLLALEILW